MPPSVERTLVDLHVHTDLVDAFIRPKHFASGAKEAGLTAIAKTDHHTLGKWEKTKDFCEQSGIVYINGVEVTNGARWENSYLNWHRPHILVENLPSEDIQNFLDSHPPHRLPSTKDTLEWARSFDNALIIAPHVKHYGDITSLSTQELLALGRYFHAIEIFNEAPPNPLKKPKKFKKYLEQALLRWQLADALDLTAVASSDAHYKEDIGCIATELFEVPYSAQDVVDQVKKGACSPYIPQFLQKDTRVLIEVTFGISVDGQLLRNQDLQLGADLGLTKNLILLSK